MQMLPGQFEAPLQDAGQGTSVMCVTLGFATLIFAAYYQAMQLQSSIDDM
jgi:hypothetical protein